MSGRIYYTIQDNTGLYPVGRYYPRWNLNLESKDKKMIAIFKKGIEQGDYKGHVKLTRSVLHANWIFPKEEIIAEIHNSKDLYREPLAELCRIEGEE